MKPLNDTTIHFQNGDQKHAHSSTDVGSPSSDRHSGTMAQPPGSSLIPAVGTVRKGGSPLLDSWAAISPSMRAGLVLIVLVAVIALAATQWPKDGDQIQQSQPPGTPAAITPPSTLHTQFEPSIPPDQTENTKREPALTLIAGQEPNRAVACPCPYSRVSRPAQASAAALLQAPKPSPESSPG